MKALLFHCKEIETIITGLATRPAGIVHGEVIDEKQSSHDCIVAFVTVEAGDTVKMTDDLVNEIIKFCGDTKHKNVFLSPFAHLSNNLAKSSEAIPVFEITSEKLRTAGINLTEGHFGSDKELLIHLYGHPGNARFREF